MNRMYYEDRKNQFLVEHFSSEDSRVIAKYVFYHSYLNEMTLEKDLYDFNTDQIRSTIINSNPKSVNVAMSRGSVISQYITWAINNNLRKSELNPLQEIGEDFYSDLVDENIKQFISKAELDYIIDNLVNYQDKVIPLLLFNGIYGTQSSEIRNITIQDVNDIKDNMLRVVDDAKGERYVEVDDYLIDMLIKAHEEDHYYNRNGTSEGRYEKSPLADAKYIIKKSKKGKETDAKASQIIIIKRIDMMMEFFDMPDITPKSINRSGMLYEASKLIGNKDELSQEDFTKIGERFSLSKMSSGGYEYYNTTYLKGYINRENIEKLYKI